MTAVFILRLWKTGQVTHLLGSSDIRSEPVPLASTEQSETCPSFLRKDTGLSFSLHV